MMIHTIYQAGGLEPVMKIIEDPTLLLSEYNKAAERIKIKPESESVYLFDSALVEETKGIGQSLREP